MKKISLLVLVAFFAISCSSLDKFKTPEKADGGLAEGEKSNYLLNRPDDAGKKSETATKTSAKKKTATKKKTK